MYHQQFFFSFLYARKIVGLLPSSLDIHLPKTPFNLHLFINIESLPCSGSTWPDPVSDRAELANSALHSDNIQENQSTLFVPDVDRDLF